MNVEIVNSDPLLDASAAADYLGVSKTVRHPEQLVRALARKRRLTHTRVGGFLMFKKSWLDAYLVARTVEAVR